MVKGHPSPRVGPGDTIVKLELNPQDMWHVINVDGHINAVSIPGPAPIHDQVTMMVNFICRGWATIPRYLIKHHSK